MLLLKKTSYSSIYLTLSLLLVVAIVLSAGTGAVYLSFREISSLIAHKAFGNGIVNPVHEGLFFQIRLPRTILCLFVGAALSVSGALMQSLFRNPIVEPGLVGTSAGSALGAALFIVLGSNSFFSHLSFMSELLMPVCAFLGGLVATVIVYYFSASLNRVNISVMILAGIAVNAIANGATGFLAYIARDPQARSITFWNLGSFAGANWTAVAFAGASTIVGFFLSLRFAKSLNALQLGDTEAGYLGVNTERLKISIILINTLLVSIATSLVGIIAFVGLIIPHLLRLMKGSDNRYLIIGSALLGAIVLSITDMVCRVVIAPAEMPIGIITAFIGAPVFLWLLNRMKNNGQKGGFYA
ncbi:FecCD family ABC transporter permease [Flavisolibacter ginsengisoli]|jgi:iron complex transport system permease protein|uniref:Iron complex transport system permease protein n=1 Tax=Flavisolibacter ginsengisoli DSM 18119 TaxID=1121884 RepID=A0A1M5BL73_9BACT|nr:iron ABC transporter permease [Flavisolibacter ginsengisoli]SHF43281.1 iron complex transport system permease protein [Flavisolibacter ginsengisoli DSM 18119]